MVPRHARVLLSQPSPASSAAGDGDGVEETGAALTSALMKLPTMPRVPGQESSLVSLSPSLFSS